MYELIKVDKNSYYIECPVRVMIYVKDSSAYLIDTGNDKEMGKKIYKILEENKWDLKGIINTHSHADHIGGNKFLQERTGCKIYSSKLEKAFIENPEYESIFLYGSNPLEKLKNKFLYAERSEVNGHLDKIDEDLEIISIKGHCADMIGVRTKNNVVFIADALFSENIINKYHIMFMYNIEEYFETLEILSKMEAELFIMSHAEASKDIKNLIQINKNKVEEIIKLVLDNADKSTFEEILQGVMNHYNLVLDLNQYVLVGSTLKAYLTYLAKIGKLEYYFENNKMLWKAID